MEGIKRKEIFTKTLKKMTKQRKKRIFLDYL